MKNFIALLTLFLSVTANAQSVIPRPGGAPSYKQATTSVTTLPLVGNTPGDSRFVLDTFDYYVWNGSSWQKVPVSFTGSVTSVYGRTGAIAAQAGDYSAFYDTLGAAAAISAQKGQPNGYATLDAGGLLPTAQLPPLAITNTFVDASQAAMLAETATVGDVSVRTDINQNFILQTAGPTVLGHWVQLLTPAAPVQSVNGFVGTVSLAQGNLTDAGTDGITVTSGTNAVWGAGTSIAQHVADTTHAGYLASADWNTFNGKQPAGSYLVTTNNLSDLNNAGTARTNLGLGSVATQAANNVAITGGAIDGTVIGATTKAAGSFSSLTDTGTLVDSVNGALSTPAVSITGTPVTGGSGTTTFPLVYLNSGTAPTTFSTAGTELGINAPSGYTGNFLDLHLNGGASVLNIPVTGGMTTTGNISAGIVQTSSAISNFYNPSTTGFTPQSVATLQFAGSSNVDVRTGMEMGTTSSIMTAGYNYGGLIVGSGLITTAATGTHPWLANEVINPIGTVTSGGAAITNTANLYVDAPSAAGTNNYSLYVNGPSSQSGSMTNTTAGAASASAVSITGAPFTGGSGTTTTPLIYANSGTAPTTFNTSGTILGVNAPSGFIGNYLDFHLNGGASTFSVDRVGDLSASGFLASSVGLSLSALSNVYAPVIQLGQNVTAATVIYAGNANNHVRVGLGVGGTTTAALSVGANYSNTIIGSDPVTVAASGTNPWLANEVVNPLGAVTGAAAVTNTASLYVGAASSAGTNNYSLYVAGDEGITGHILPKGTAPAVAVNANAGTSATCTVSNATDLSGTVQLVTGSAAWASGTQCTITFNAAYGVAPKCTLTALDATTQSLDTEHFIGTTTTTLTLGFSSADLAATTYNWAYTCMQ